MTTPHKVEFNKEKHEYKVDGQVVTGVTTILNGGLPKGGLVYWAGKTVAEYVRDNYHDLNPDDPEFVKRLAAVPNKRKKKAGDRGTRIHDNAEKLAHGLDVKITEDIKETEQVARFLEKWEIETVLTERQVVLFDPLACGTFDFIGRSPKINGGELFMSDWKSSNNVYGDVSMQLAPYCRADGFLGEDGDLHPMPEINYNMVWHITPESVNAHPVSINKAEVDEAFEWFKAAYTTWKNTGARKKRLRPPLTDIPAEFYNTLKTGEAA